MLLIRQIQASEGAALRAIRLCAIRDTPDAFAVSLADTLAQSEEGWAAWATQSSIGASRIMYIAEEGGGWVGMAGGMLDPAQPEHGAQLISMWVDPTYRGRGIGRQLVERIVAWALSRAVPRLALWVTAGNTAAIALYTRCGFEESGEIQPRPEQPAILEQRMVRDLGDPVYVAIRQRRSRTPS